ncbi:unnamed protein product (macronuclear) [Paramecium tetraurelia]|uniref:Uncharacterized protein n=1 Tax=Paramecium tetraurelia TaxID=5888 RepID=A0EDW2_PARTE|nr:uncharacterized protein GSPATT00025823001 [Paramecium tetraurelia]CAK93479.1 unnamed protein product [Paramecium tetraurelia]|eukprot:XP_001460876.1 hypothetical protein (macronuclear) [Paramecium tetraurelia strain d4-2]
MKRPESAHTSQISANRFKVSSKQSPISTEGDAKSKNQKQQYQKQKLNIPLDIKLNSEDQDMNRVNIFQIQSWNSDQFDSIPSLKNTIQTQQNEIFILKQKLLFHQNLVKTQPMKELQTQIVKYFEETIELKKKLDEALNNQSEAQKSSQYQSHISKIKELKQEINDINTVNEGLQKEIQKLQQQVNQQSEQLQQNCNQFQQFQTPKQHQREKTQLSQNRLVIKEIQSEGETVDNSLHAIKEKDSKIQELQLNLANLNAQINQQRQQMKQQDLLISEKKDIIENLQQEVKNLETKLVELQSSQKQRKKKQEDKGIQIQNNSKQTIEEIKAILRFRLKRSMVEQKEIQNYLLKDEDYRFFSIQSQFQKFPFFLNAEESYDITLFLLTEESPYNQNVLERDLKLTVLKSRILHLLPQYELITINEQGQLFQQISTKIINKLNYLQDAIKKIKKTQKSEIGEEFCLPQQFLEAFTFIFEYSLSKKEAEYLFQLNFEISNSPSLINFLRLIQLFQMKPKFGINKVCNLSDSLFKENELINIQGPSLIRNESAVPKVSPKQINIYASKFQQTDEAELGIDRKQKKLQYQSIIGLNRPPTFDKVEVGVCCQKQLVIVQQNELSYNNNKVRVDQDNLEKVKYEQYLQQQLQKEKQKEELSKVESNKNKEIKSIVSLYFDQLLQDFINSSKQD